MIRQIPALEPNEGQRAQMARRFGMFIHFGVNTFGNVQWSDGGIQARSFKPETIDAEGWVKIAYQAGMNTVILTCKHHDGFCLWNTETTNYGVMFSGKKVDIVRAVAQACARYGLKFGVYYSLWDRSASCYRSDFEGEYIPYMFKQLTELLDGRYGEVVELWLDGAWDKTRAQWHLDELYDLVKRLQPSCQIGVNHTVGVDREMAEFPEERYLPQNVVRGDPLRMFPSDFRLWDPHSCRLDDPKIFTFQGESYYLPFEMTICSREGFSWFYSNIYEDEKLLDVNEVVEKYKTAFSAGNIVVINMPPDTSGHFVVQDVAHLMEISEKLGLSRGE